MLNQKKKFTDQHEEAHFDIIPDKSGKKIQQFYLSSIGIPPYDNNSVGIGCRKDYQIRTSQVEGRNDYLIHEEIR